MRFLPILSVIVFIFIGCSSQPGTNIQGQPEPSAQITFEDLIGDWELSRWTVQTERNKFENDMTQMDLKIWSFAKDSIAVTCYPLYLFNYKPYKMVGDSLYYSWNKGSDFQEKYRIEFKGDTLLMTTTASLIMGSKVSGPDTSYTTFRNYLVRKDVDQDTLKNIKSTLVDWSFYQRKWTYQSSFCIEPFDSPTADSIAIPIVIDLTDKNASSYSFDKTSLKYFDTKTKQWYKLDFGGHGHTNGELSTLFLGAYSPDSTQLNSIRYVDAK